MLTPEIMNDAEAIALALEEAKSAALRGEVPVGAVLLSPDGTVLARDGRLWFFLSLIDRPGSAQLFLFSAPSLFDKWEYHPANPISLDIRTARCGGSFLEDSGRTIRVAQDGSRRYGYALRFQEMELLNEREYRERPLSRLMPEDLERGLLGVHTYNRSAVMELLDGQRREPKRNLS